MLEVVCFKWKPMVSYYRSQFTGEHVNVLRNMVARNYNHPHRFTCITDNPEGIDNNIRIIPLWKDHSRLWSPHGRHQPSCYRRLKIFSAEAKELIGERIATLDLDVVITGDLGPIWNRPEDFVMLKSATYHNAYNGSMVLLRAGTRTKVWEAFDPIMSPIKSKKAKQFGSDQGWISYKLGGHEATWDTNDGVYSFRVHLEPDNPHVLPNNAKVVVFHGATDPWSESAQQIEWVREHWH